jgi:hypothetical protein
MNLHKLREEVALDGWIVTDIDDSDIQIQDPHFTATKDGVEVYVGLSMMACTACEGDAPWTVTYWINSEELRMLVCHTIEDVQHVIDERRCAVLGARKRGEE